jgi:hypothetical protein
MANRDELTDQTKKYAMNGATCGVDVWMSVHGFRMEANGKNKFWEIRRTSWHLAKIKISYLSASSIVVKAYVFPSLLAVSSQEHVDRNWLFRFPFFIFVLQFPKQHRLHYLGQPEESSRSSVLTTLCHRPSVFKCRRVMYVTHALATRRCLLDYWMYGTHQYMPRVPLFKLNPPHTIF